ncbi:GWxTD domain-containing protein [Rosettibacter firmus]|uniref:GWxTD domain-containing protein n=1 Tax=Rosettibacter firmus TaxID=3111522 RepID=UPI00336BE699
MIQNVYSEHYKNITELNIKGKKALENKDTLLAEKFFLESIRKYNDADSYYQLGNINLKRNTYNFRNLAYEYFKKATLLEPHNINYRFAYATLMKDFAKISAIREFQKILEIDSTHIPTYLSLAELKSLEFNEYNNSVRKLSDEFYASLQDYANKDFYEAENYYLKALKLDSTNYEANFKLSLLYENAGKPEKGIPLLIRLINLKKDDKDIHLLLGLLYYKTSKFNLSYNEYRKAIALMNREEKEDFTFNTVKFLIEPLYQNVINRISEIELKKFIDVYWKVMDPLYMTDYNERLLEHYSRVVYSNLHFSVPKLGLIGWKTNRGEIVLRYGEPLNFIRLRPSMGENGFMMKTEIWDYEDMSFGFTDMASSGNYLFSWPSNEKDKVHSQFSGNTLDYINTLRKIRYSFYEPKYEGPNFDINYSVLQFKSEKKLYQTDMYFNYLIDVPDSLFNTNEKIKHKIGIFFFDKYYEEQLKKIDSIIINKNEKDKYVNTLAVSSYPDSGFISFEIIREGDNGTYSNREDFEIKRFSNTELCLSDILLSKKISKEKIKGILRKNIYFTPDPLNQFSRSDSIYLYYEIYNLRRNENGICDFEQRISIKKYKEKSESGFEKIASAVSNIFGLNDDSEIIVTSNYKTLEDSPQIILQLDMKNYLPEKYSITITIKDNISKREVSSSTFINLSE